MDKIDGAKDLVLSKTILVQLDSICGMQKLRQNAVDKVFRLQADSIKSDTKNRVYVIRPSVDEVRIVANQIEDYLGQDDYQPVDIKFWIIFVPRLTHYCDLVLEEEGIYEYVSVLDCPLGLIPIEYDVYSLEDDTIFKGLFLNKDITSLSVIVDSITQLQVLSGNIIDIHGQGKCSEIVAKKLDEVNLKYGHVMNKSTNSMSQIRRNIDELNFKEHENSNPSFTDIYLFDRDTDYASVLLSQMNYEGILDESFNICCNKLEFNSTKSDAEPTSVRHTLTSDQDPIFRDIRDNHFSTVFSLVKTKNNELKEKYGRLNIANLRNFVANELKGIQLERKCLDLHLSACEEIMKERNRYDFSDQLKTEESILEGIDMKKCSEYITKMIRHQLHPHVPLRLLSLLSLTQGGLLPHEYLKYQSSYCENYGLFNHATFSNLKKLGLITEMDLSLNALTSGLLNYNSNGFTSSKSNNRLSSFTGAMSSFTEKASGKVAAVVSTSVLPRRGILSQLIKKFQLVPDIGDSRYNFRDPKDPAFVFTGTYIPLVCQLVDKCVLNSGKKENSSIINPDAMKLLPGPYFKRKQAFLDNLQAKVVMDESKNQYERSLLVYFIGGVTYAEITALRFIAKQKKIKIAIATTSIINGNKLVSSLCPIER